MTIWPVRPGSLRRRVAATYMAGFLFATAASPHRHENPMVDLVSDGRSDSGVLARCSAACEPGGQARFERLWLIDDDPCLACFPHDFVAAAASAFLFRSPVSRPAGIDSARTAHAPRLRAKAPSSRSPPPPA